MVRVPTHRPPTHPGEMLLEEFLRPLGVTQRQLADAIQVPYQRVNEIVNGRRGVIPSTALRLARYLGTSVDFWLNLQQRWDLYRAMQDEQKEIQKIRPLSAWTNRHWSTGSGVGVVRGRGKPGRSRRSGAASPGPDGPGAP